MPVIAGLQNAEGFTESERSLAGYILDHADEVAHMSITCLAERAYTSNASIIRLCRKLGVEGYRDFRIELATELERSRSSRVGVDVNHPFTSKENAAAIMGGLAAVLEEAIDASHSSVDPRAIDAAARLIRHSRRVYIFAIGDSRISAMAFANMLLKLGVHCIFADEYGETWANVSSVEPGDVGLWVSYSGKVVNSAVMQRVVQLFKERKCSMVWLSSAPKPLGMDVELRFPARELEHGKVATFYSQMCIRYLLNCLFGAIYALDYEGSISRVDQVDELNIMLGALNSF